jgi:hypothetical protein
LVITFEFGSLIPANFDGGISPLRTTWNDGVTALVCQLSPCFSGTENLSVPSLRWSDDWDIATFDHFRGKWRLENDRYFQVQYKNVGWRRPELMMKQGLLIWLYSTKLRAGAERLLRPLERRVNKSIARRYAG